MHPDQTPAPAYEQSATARFIAQGACRFPNRPFIESINQHKSITYAELDAITNRVARCLENWKIRLQLPVPLVRGAEHRRPVWDATVFSKNRDRLLGGEVATGFFNAVPGQARERGLLSDQHFTVTGR